MSAEGGITRPIFQSDWVKIATLLGALVVFLFTIGTWWGETQNELKSIGAAVGRLDANIADFTKRVNDHEYRLRSLEDARRNPGRDR